MSCLAAGCSQVLARSMHTCWNSEPMMQGTADMLDELFGHMLAALRFGASQAACSSALDIAFELHPSQPQVQP